MPRRRLTVVLVLGGLLPIISALLGYPWPDFTVKAAPSAPPPMERSLTVYGAPRTFPANHAQPVECDHGADKWSVYLYYRTIYGDVRMYEAETCSRDEAKAYALRAEQWGFDMQIPLSPHIAHAALLRVEFLDEVDD